MNPISAERLQTKMLTDFATFLRVLWHHLRLPEPTRAQLAMARYLQYGGPRIQLQMFRGVGKSWVTAAFVIWTLYCDQNKKVLVVSASKQRADDFSLFVQRCIMDFPFLQHLDNSGKDNRWSRVSFDVKGAEPAQSPSVKSVGITSAMVGSRADLIVPDDIESPENSASDIQREKLLQRTQEFESILTPLPTSRIVYLGTPQTIFSVYSKLELRGYRAMVWPSRYPYLEQLPGYEGRLAEELEEDIREHRLDKLAWMPTDTRFSDVLLREKEAATTKANFQLQFQLDTSMSDALKYPLRLADIPVVSLDPRKAPGTVIWSQDPLNRITDLEAISLPGDHWFRPARLGDDWFDWPSDTIISVDPSGRGKDETGVAILSQLAGNVYLRALRGFADGYSDATLTAILKLGKQYGATCCLVESNFGDGTVVALLQKHARELQIPMLFEETRAFVRKEDRILDALEPVTTQHRLIIDRGVIEYDLASNQDLPMEERLQKTLAYQLTRLCRDKGALKHDDRVDAVAQGVAYFTDRLNVSQFEESKRLNRDAYAAMLERSEADGSAFADDLVLGDARAHLQRLAEQAQRDRPRPQMRGNVSAQVRKASGRP
jgi:hypothetical protein